MRPGETQAAMLSKLIIMRGKKPRLLSSSQKALLAYAEGRCGVRWLDLVSEGLTSAHKSWFSRSRTTGW